MRWGKKAALSGRNGVSANGIVLAALSVVVAVLADVSLSQARAQSGQGQAPGNYNIPSGSMAAVLNRFAEASNLQLIYSGVVTRGLRSQGLQGSYTPAQALGGILRGSGLTYRYTGPSSVTIESQAESVSIGETPEGLIELEELVISSGSDRPAGFQGTPDRVYEEPSSTSVVSREAIQNSPSRNARDALDSVAGVYADRSNTQNPGISVNVRGLYDNGRVATMVDGARQNFQRSGHGSGQRSYVDTAFIREIEIEKSGTAGVGSGGSLGGYVDFRTVGADDFIDEGEIAGAELNVATGTNEYNFDGSAAAAVRISDSFALTAGVSHKRLGQYDIGENGWDVIVGDLKGDLEPPVFTGLESWSNIVKAEFEPTDDLKLTFGWVRYQADSSEGALENDGSYSKRESTEDITNHTLTSHLQWDPATDLVDLNVRLWYNHLKNLEYDPGTDKLPETDSEFRFATLGGSIDNTSGLETALGALSLNYGAEAFRDDGRRHSMNALIASDPDLASGYGGNDPAATRDVASGFFNTTLEHEDWLTASVGLRYDWYHMKGETTWYSQEQVLVPDGHWVYCDFWLSDITGDPADAGICIGTPTHWVDTSYPDTDYSAHHDSVDKSDDAWLPMASVAVKPFDWLQTFVKYGHTFRPPTINESLISGGHASGGANPAFEFAPNPDLRPETARTLEIGANIMKDGIFREDDTFRMKAVWFTRDVEDYIVMGSFQRPEVPDIVYRTYLNVDGTTKMDGVEIEANYDARRFYVGASFTYLNTDWATDYVAPPGTPIGYDGIVGSIYVPPKIKFTIDAGMRFFDEALVVGGRVTGVGATDEGFGHSAVMPYGAREYTLYDIYGSYAFTDEVKLRFAVNNITDLAYVPALGAWEYPAPGRTGIVTLNVKF